MKDDLEKLGLVTSPEKCCWIPKQQFTWCGFDCDLAQFTVAVTEEKRTRIKDLARELMSKDRVTVKEVLQGWLYLVPQLLAGALGSTPDPP